MNNDGQQRNWKRLVVLLSALAIALWWALSRATPPTDAGENLPTGAWRSPPRLARSSNNDPLVDPSSVVTVATCGPEPLTLWQRQPGAVDDMEGSPLVDAACTPTKNPNECTYSGLDEGWYRVSQDGAFARFTLASAKANGVKLPCETGCEQTIVVVSRDACATSGEVSIGAYAPDMTFSAIMTRQWTEGAPVSFRNLRCSDHTARAAAPGCTPAWRRFVPSPTVLKLQPSTDPELSLHVQEAGTGLALAGAAVEAGFNSKETDREGNATIPLDQRDPGYLLTVVSKSGYASREILTFDVEWKPSGDATGTVEMSRLREHTVRCYQGALPCDSDVVVHVSGGPQRGRQRRCTSLGDGQWRCPVTEGDSAYGLDGTIAIEPVRVDLSTDETSIYLDESVSAVCLDLEGRANCKAVVERLPKPVWVSDGDEVKWSDGTGLSRRIGVMCADGAWTDEVLPGSGSPCVKVDIEPYGVICTNTLEECTGSGGYPRWPGAIDGGFLIQPCSHQLPAGQWTVTCEGPQRFTVEVKPGQTTLVED